MGAFGEVLRPPDLLRRMPSGLYPAGLAASIGLMFAPQVRRAFTAIREASELRGHRPKGLHDLPSLVSPLVVLSLENALAVAEGMVARGWGNVHARGIRRLGAAVGWLALGAGIALGVVLPERAAPAVGLVLFGAAAAWLTTRRANGRHRYRPDIWTRGDTIVSGLSLGVLSVFLLLSLAAPFLLTYYPYPRAVWPSFHPAIAAAIALLCAPLVPCHDSR
jgi:hypothetical protein